MPKDFVELAWIFRQGLPEKVQEGWDQFQFTRIFGRVDCVKLQVASRRIIRFTATAWAVALITMYVIMTWFHFARELPVVNCVILALAATAWAPFMTGIMWLILRKELSEARDRERKFTETTSA